MYRHQGEKRKNMTNTNKCQSLNRLMYRHASETNQPTIDTMCQSLNRLMYRHRLVVALFKRLGLVSIP